MIHGSGHQVNWHGCRGGGPTVLVMIHVKLPQAQVRYPQVSLAGRRHGPCQRPRRWLARGPVGSAQLAPALGEVHGARDRGPEHGPGASGGRWEAGLITLGNAAGGAAALRGPAAAEEEECVAPPPALLGGWTTERGVVSVVVLGDGLLELEVDGIYGPRRRRLSLVPPSLSQHLPFSFFSNQLQAN